MNRLYEINISFPAGAGEIITAALIDLGTAGFEEGNDFIRWFTESQPNTDELKAELLRRLELGGISGALHVSVEQADNNANWADAWKEHWRAVEISPQLAVAPAWLEYAPHPGQKVVRLETTSAFGTGSHETTAMCLEILARELQQKPGASVLDVGSGSGVLSIAAELLGARVVYGIDIDPLAVETARANAAANNCRHCQFSAKNLSDLTDRFDIVLANILSSTIIELWPAMQSRLSPAGKFILSGVLREEVDALLSTLQISQLEIVESGEWVALVI